MGASLPRPEVFALTRRAGRGRSPSYVKHIHIDSLGLLHLGPLLLGLLMTPACAQGGSAGPGAIDAATGLQAASPEASTSPDVAVVADAGAPTEASSDVFVTVDAAPPRADVPAVACTDAVDDVYVTPPSLPPFAAGARGDVVRCARDAALSQSEVQARITAHGIKTPATTDVTLYRIAYRTTRGNGAAGVSTARVYLPQHPMSLPLPVVTIGHPTNGLASSCAPSKDPASNEDLALPWAAVGYAVIVPDYAGLGNDDATQGYVDNHDTAFSTLDGARALRKLLSPGAFSEKVLMAGWSQGGGAVLSSSALAKSYGCDGTLAGVIVFAPEWPTRMNSFGYVNMLRDPSALTILNGVSNPVVAVLRQYAYESLYVGASSAESTFPAANQAGIGGAVTSLCETPLGGYLQAFDATIGAFIDEAFRTSFLACVDGDGGAGCTGSAKGYYSFLQQNVLTADPNGPPTLYVQGLSDLIMPAASEAACNLQKLAGDGVAPQVCVDAAAQHTDVVPRNIDFALGWGQAVLAGTTPPACSAAGMPACTP